MRYPSGLVVKFEEFEAVMTALAAHIGFNDQERYELLQLAVSIKHNLTREDQSERSGRRAWNSNTLTGELALLLQDVFIAVEALPADSTGTPARFMVAISWRDGSNPVDLEREIAEEHELHLVR